ncbi:MAG: diacylglycerol kinase family lipid kinase [Anaerolineales bacterium]|nr:diacylglycerol kinase family lipid kinase [Anaerolineales bacterium]
MRTAWVIYNPYAGRFPAGPLLERAADVLARADWEIDVVETKAAEQLRTVAQRAVEAGQDAVFVAGGDGSVGRVAGVLAGSETALGVLPAGTANVWARELGLPRLGWIHPLALEEAARRLARGDMHRVDLGMCEQAPFLLWAGVGLDGKIVNSIEPRARWEKAFAVAHYAFLAVWESLDWTGIDLKVRSGSQSWEGRFLLAVASNIRAYAGGYVELSPDAKIDDGLLDFWLLRGKSLTDAVGPAVNILMGRHVEAPGLIHFRAAEAEFETQGRLPLHVDGEPGPEGELVKLELRPRALKVLMPEGGWPEVFTEEEKPSTSPGWNAEV